VSKRQIDFVKDDINDHIVNMPLPRRDNKTLMIAEEANYKCCFVNFVVHHFCFGITSHHLMKYVFSLSFCCFGIMRCLAFYFEIFF
jgi:hypothetical protein